MQNITNKLVLQSIEARSWTHDEKGREVTTLFHLSFTFYGEHGFEAQVSASDLKGEYASFPFIESGTGDLHDSFSDQLEEHWSKIVAACNEWEKESFAEQTKMVNQIYKNQSEL